MLSKIKRTVFALMALSFLIILAPVHTANAAVYMSVTPTSGEVRSTVTISASGLYLGYNPTYRIYFSDQYVDISDGSDKFIDDEMTRYSYISVTCTIVDNSFSQDLNVPTSFNTGLIDKDGTYYFYLAKQFSGGSQQGGTKWLIQQVVPFEIVGFTQISLSASQGHVGDRLEIEGEGFLPGESLTIMFDGVDVTEGAPKAASSGVGAGTFNGIITVPHSTYGNKEIKVIGKTSGTKVTRTFKVLPKIVLSKTEGAVGEEITIDGSGFRGRSLVNMIFGGNPEKRVPDRVEEDGAFSYTFSVPESTTSGSYVIEVVDHNDDSIYARANFEVKVYLEPEITLNLQGETVGSTIDISGVEFNNSKNITLTIDGVTVAPDAAIKSTSTGTFSGSFTIPELPAGTHTVEASDGTMVGVASATFTVVPKAEIDKTSGKAGDTVTVTGTGFKAGTAVVINFGGDTNVTPDGAKTDAKGSFSASFTVPAVAEGTHNVKISVGSDSVTKTFTTSISMTLSPESGKSGTEVVVTVEGLEPSEVASIYFGATKLSSATISGQGKLNFIFNVPVAAEGTHSVKIEVNGITISRDFTISADATFTPTSGKVGDDISITGSGFGSAKSLTLTWDDDNIGGSSLITTAEGTFNIAFKVPAVKGGSYVISISDGTITKTQTFTVEASAPPVPQPISPALASKEKGNVTFEWKPVNYDIMGFTYQLQVSKDSTFASMLIDKTGLTTTNYSLTDAEKLDKTGTDAPYYWRVRAVDEAGNEGAWTSNANFTVGGGWPSWLTWVLIGLGVVVLGILAFWVGRRIAYYSY